MLLGRRRDKGLLVSPPQLNRDQRSVSTLFFTQKLDHFNSRYNTTWQQRYFKNDQYYRTGGPLFVFIGGEAPADIGWMTYGDWIKNARTYSAMALQLEHRYYGISHPTSDASTANLQWLSSEQALADLANFITSIKVTLGMQTAKVVVFGGSYPGNMAAWFRMKYPHVTVGAVGSSAPVTAKANFQEYLEVVGDALNHFGHDACNTSVRQAFQMVDQMVRANNVTGLKSALRLCNNVNTNDAMAVATAVGIAIDPFMGDVQYNSNNPNSNTVIQDCAIMTNAGTGDPLKRLTNFINQKYGGSCVDNNYNSDVTELQKSSWTARYIGSRLWLWQTCTEFGYYQGTDSSKQPFGTSMPYITELREYCTAVFGLTEATVNSLIDQTNFIYGSTNLQVTNVVLPNGSLDPWHALGIFLSDINPSALARYIPYTSHCMDMMETSPYDSTELTNARNTIQAQIQLWLR